MTRLSALIAALQGSPPCAEREPRAGGLSARWLFATAAQAMLVVDAGNLRVVEANLAATERLAKARDSVIDLPFTRGLDRRSAAAAEALLARISAGATDEAVTVRQFDGGSESRLHASLFEMGGHRYFLVRLDSVHGPAGPPGRAGSAAPPAMATALDLLDDAAEAIVIADPELVVQYANRAFTRFTEATGTPVGRPVTDWLALSNGQIADIAARFRTREALKALEAHVVVAAGAPRAATIDVIVVPDGEMPCCTFLIRPRPDA